MDPSIFYGKKRQTNKGELLTRIINNASHSEDSLLRDSDMEDEVVEFEKTAGEKGSVDEQMIAFKGRHSIKQYIKSKPKKWGYKAFVLCGSDGIVYNWELYTGAINQDPELPDIGVSGIVVL